MARLKLALIGCGDIARFTAFFARLNPGIDPVACCDVSTERAEKFGRRHKIREIYSDYDELLNHSAVDAVYLAVPHDCHAAMIKRAIAAGKAVLCEKPITRTYAEGVEIVRLAEENGIKLAVNYQYRYDAAGYRLARAVQAGALGELRYGRINIPWRRKQQYFQDAPWHQSLARAGGGTLLTQGSHFLDLALWACASNPLRVTGVVTRQVFKQVEVEDLAMGIIELENGALLEICSSMTAASEQPATIEIYGSKATAFYTDRLLPRLRFVGSRVKTETVPVLGIHALQRSIEAFRRWVGGGQPHLATGREALLVLKVVEKIYQSAETGKHVSISE